MNIYSNNKTHKSQNWSIYSGLGSDQSILSTSISTLNKGTCSVGSYMKSVTTEHFLVTGQSWFWKQIYPVDMDEMTSTRDERERLLTCSSTSTHVENAVTIIKRKGNTEFTLLKTCGDLQHRGGFLILLEIKCRKTNNNEGCYKRKTDKCRLDLRHPSRSIHPKLHDLLYLHTFKITLTSYI